MHRRPHPRWMLLALPALPACGAAEAPHNHGRTTAPSPIASRRPRTGRRTSTTPPAMRGSAPRRCRGDGNQERDDGGRRRRGPGTSCPTCHARSAAGQGARAGRGARHGALHARARGARGARERGGARGGRGLSGLPAGAVDRVLVVDTWHHIAGREAYAAKLRAALAPGGAVLWSTSGSRRSTDLLPTTGSRRTW